MEGGIVNRCKFCGEHNGDHFDDEDERYDYYSCELMNDYDSQQNGYYSSKGNEVNEEKCKHYLCDSCEFKDTLEKLYGRNYG
jgi:hypothetical protein